MNNKNLLDELEEENYFGESDLDFCPNDEI